MGTRKLKLVGYLYPRTVVLLHGPAAARFDRWAMAVGTFLFADFDVVANPAVALTRTRLAPAVVPDYRGRGERSARVFDVYVDPVMAVLNCHLGVRQQLVIPHRRVPQALAEAIENRAQAHLWPDDPFDER